MSKDSLSFEVKILSVIISGPEYGGGVGATKSNFGFLIRSLPKIHRLFDIIDSIRGLPPTFSQIKTPKSLFGLKGL
jgi:hypothetical protein